MKEFICTPEGRPWEGAGDAMNRFRLAGIPAEVNQDWPRHASGICVSPASGNHQHLRDDASLY